MPQSLAAPETTQSSDERKAKDTDTPAVQVNLIEHKGLHLNNFLLILLPLRMTNIKFLFTK